MAYIVSKASTASKSNSTKIIIGIVAVIVVIGIFFLFSSGSHQLSNQEGTIGNPYNSDQGYLGVGYYSIGGQSTYISSQSQLNAALNGQTTTTPTTIQSNQTQNVTTTIQQAQQNFFFRMTNWRFTANYYPALTLNFTTSVPSSYLYDSNANTSFTFTFPNGTVDSGPFNPYLSSYSYQPETINGNISFNLKPGYVLMNTPPPATGRYAITFKYQGRELFNKTFNFSGSNVSVVGIAYGTTDAFLPDYAAGVNYSWITPVLITLYNFGDLPVPINRGSVYTDDMQGTIDNFGSFYLQTGAIWLMPKQCIVFKEGSLHYDGPGTYKLEIAYYDTANRTVAKSQDLISVPSIQGTPADLTYRNSTCTIIS